MERKKVQIATLINEKNEIERQLRNLTTEKNELENNFAAATAELTAKTEENQGLEASLATEIRAKNKAQTKLSDTQEELKNKTEEVNNSQEQINNLDSQLRNTLQS